MTSHLAKLPMQKRICRLMKPSSMGRCFDLSHEVDKSFLSTTCSTSTKDLPGVGEKKPRRIRKPCAKSTVTGVTKASIPTLTKPSCGTKPSHTTTLYAAILLARKQGASDVGRKKVTSRLLADEKFQTDRSGESPIPAFSSTPRRVMYQRRNSFVIHRRPGWFMSDPSLASVVDKYQHGPVSSSALNSVHRHHAGSSSSASSSASVVESMRNYEWSAEAEATANETKKI